MALSHEWDCCVLFLPFIDHKVPLYTSSRGKARGECDAAETTVIHLCMELPVYVVMYCNVCHSVVTFLIAHIYAYIVKTYSSLVRVGRVAEWLKRRIRDLGV